mmetsp:Transcript_6739/g.8998  ORF Transcript_6739/g.8998 Transcript_6739/m.8998 type:complete len:532 (+) Transcript_6739:43-1638(+)
MLPPQFDMKLFLVACSAAGRAVWLYLHECEALFVVDKLNPEELLSKLEDFSPKRPIGINLPVLHDSGFYLYGCTSILKYLGEKFGKFYPSDRTERAKIDMYFEWHLQHLHRTTALVLELTTPSSPGLFRNYIAESEEALSGGEMTEKRTTDIELVAAAIKEYISMLIVLERVFLANSEFLCGNSLTIADLYAASELSFHEIIDVNFKEFPKVATWYERVTSSLKSWGAVNADFEDFAPNATQQQNALRQEQKNIKKHGKNAHGGTRPPDVCHRVLYHRPIHEVYLMLLDEVQMSEMTGKPCSIQAVANGKFSFYDGFFQGKTLYLMDNVKLLQGWINSDWPSNSKTSTVKIQFTKITETKTELCLEQSDIPKGYLKKVDEAWHTMFWMPTGGVLLRDIAYTLFFDTATPHMIYELLLDSARISKYTGKKSDLSRGVGAQFSLLDGAVTGTILELVTDSKIAQEWRGNDWQEGHTSKLVIILRRISLGTELTFSQLNVPVEKYKMVIEIWERYFWKKIRTEVKNNYETLSGL